MDQEDQQHQLRWRELLTEPRMGQFTYWRRKLEVSPDEDLKWEVETLILYVNWLCYRIIYIRSKHAEWLPCTACLSTSVLIAQAFFVLERRHVVRHTKSQMPLITQLYCRHGKVTMKSWMLQDRCRFNGWKCRGVDPYGTGGTLRLGLFYPVTATTVVCCI